MTTRELQRPAASLDRCQQRDKAMTEIVRLWRHEQLPIKNGVYFADGRSYTIDVVRSGLSVGERFEQHQPPNP